MKNKFKYVVVVSCSFDGDVPVYLFDDYDKAKEYLHDMWQYGYNEELTESVIPLDEENTFYNDEEAYGKITWADGDYMEYILTMTSEPMKINGKDYK